MKPVDVASALLDRAAADAESLLRGLTADISSLTDARRDANSDDEHDPEGTTLAWERSQADSLRLDAVARLAAVAAARARVAEGTYGTCIRCGGPIAPGRLEARPWTDRCVACADAP
ncbi:MAG: DNA-binding protein [Naasia sp.]|jgi:DnaK suppressor protein|uniref:TraR/DksA family transcriptional regulator n=1 Tax=Naasia sp. TaxID=2546198 RepID=UPI00262C3EF7|nr:TraR/DksA C4-type zinc finger protein [Naasia sp.]MCU1570038.1 DNA-binding protein [Naasia sp.]